jgi:hypothetical protein
MVVEKRDMPGEKVKVLYPVFIHVLSIDLAGCTHWANFLEE